MKASFEEVPGENRGHPDGSIGHALARWISAGVSTPAAHWIPRLYGVVVHSLLVVQLPGVTRVPGLLSTYCVQE